MESQNIGGSSNIRNGGGMQLDKEANQRRVVSWESLVRLFVVLLTLSAAIVLGSDKQTKVIPIKVVPTLPPLYVPVSSKWQYNSAYLYLLIADIIACVYAVFSLVLAFTLRGRRKSLLELLIIVLDILMAMLLFSAVGAASAIGMIGYHGNKHAMWNKVCNVFVKFCHKVLASVALSMIAALALILPVVFAVWRLNKRSA